jgi:hypothetical protein
MSDTNHYVDNKLLLAACIEYREAVQLSKKNGTEKPRIPNYIGKCMLMIAQRLSYKPNFINYSYREEMISDGIENCISYIDNFDPTKSNNPFAYFTQIIYYAFLRRIQKEKKQLYIKHKVLGNSLLMNTLIEQGEGDDGEFTPSYIDMENENMNDFIISFEEGLDKKKKLRKKGLEKFIEEEIEPDDQNSDIG